jgi:hypothetical protein
MRQPTLSTPLHRVPARAPARSPARVRRGAAAALAVLLSAGMTALAGVPDPQTEGTLVSTDLWTSTVDTTTALVEAADTAEAGADPMVLVAEAQVTDTAVLAPGRAWPRQQVAAVGPAALHRE